MRKRRKRRVTPLGRYGYSPVGDVTPENFPKPRDGDRMFGPRHSGGVSDRQLQDASDTDAN